jgi:hypothetical protein
MVSSFKVVVFCLLSLAAPAFAGSQIYRYTDDSGTRNLTTEWEWIPEKYRKGAVPLELEQAPHAAPPALQPTIRILSSAGEYRLGDHDTRIDGMRIAVENAKRQALAQVATYLESVTEINKLDLTRDEIRTYTAGIVTVLDQQTTTRVEQGEIVMHVDLTARVDEREVIQALAALQEHESAKRQLVSVRAESDQLRRQLDMAHLGLSAATTPDEVHELTAQRQDMLNQMQASGPIAQEKTDKSRPASETGYPSSLARLKRFLAGGLP